LQGHVSRLRRLLGADAIVTRPPGYALEGADVDAARFARLLEAPPQETPAARSERLAAALALWRGPTLADVADEPGLAAEARRLEELRLAAEEDRVDADLALGRHTDLVPRLEELAAADPLRERPVAQLMLALYRSGRPGDALAAFRAFRARLRENVGLDPSAELRELERRVLVQDPTLAPPPAAAEAAPLRVPVTVVAVALRAEGDDPEVYGRALTEAREAVRLVLERNGASVPTAAGTTLVGLFGVPLPHEDDAARALRAVDELRGDPHARGIGVVSGEAFAGETPAVAAAVELAGRDGAVPAVDPLTHARARARRLRAGAPLAGRDAERQALRDAYAATLGEGRSRLVSIVGAAGIGKSRLVSELLAETGDQARVLLVRCISYGDGVTLLPAIDLVRGAAELPTGATAEQASAQLATLLRQDDRGDVAAEQLVRLLGLTADPPEDDSLWAVRRLLVAQARSRPLVVVVDDLHWASPQIVDLVRQLGRPVYAPMLVLTTARTAEAAAVGGAALPLAPLDAAACAEVVESLLGRPADPATLDRLVRASGGNPLFLEELVLALEEGTLAQPEPLESLLASRFARLPDRERDTVGSAAVIGRSITLDALRDLAGEDVSDAVDAAIDGGILQATRAEGQDLEFRHLLLRDAAYAALPLTRRAELHERHAAWLDRTTLFPPLEAEALGVYHLDQAHRARQTLDVADTRLAAAVATRAGALGRELLARGDAAAAASLLDRARALAPADDTLAVDLGRAQLDVGDFAAARTAFASASGPRARLGLLDVRLRTDPATDLAQAAAEIAAARSELEQSGDDVGVTEALLATAYLDVVRGDAAALTANLDAALASARRAGQTRAEGWILFLLCGACWYGPLPVAEGIARCEQILVEQADRPALEASALQSLAVLHAMNGSFEQARRLVAASRAIRRDVGQLVGAAASAIDEGIVELLAGDLPAAARTLGDGAEELERLGEKAYYSTAAALLAQTLAALGERDEALGFARAAAAAAAPDDVATQVGWRAAEARLVGSDDGERLAREAITVAEGTDFLLLRAEAWAALADALGDEDARATARAQLERKGCAPTAVANWTARA
ncbi:MAG TPA: BTAD domain-containing putative transcriptional regulator, partial [Gaiellaceae bacterium]|nr:BTAD domain-containing putative transcriptional regulator [Gaiellaceae bacterium]